MKYALKVTKEDPTDSFIWINDHLIDMLQAKTCPNACTHSLWDIKGSDMSK